MKNNDGSSHLHLKGKLNYQASDQFQTIVETLEKSPPPQVVLDFSSVDFIDSAGLGMLLLLRDRMPQTTHISITGANTAVKKILLLTRLEEIFTLH